ncbi:C-signal-like [Oratosquilla oratoria]|uniref:C-signal-like n=1 Tax=Oratosquilla oratoria TaxID=337810 RepID=UPI003F759D54
MNVKNVLITGANRGIGLAMVRHLLECPTPPATLVATCRNPAKADDLQKLAESHKNLKIVKLELRNFSDYPKLVETVKSYTGSEGLNLLINNGGIMEKKPGRLFGIPLEELDVEVFRDVLDVNTTGPLYLVKAFLPLLKKAAEYNKSKPVGISRAGVVNVSSIYGTMGGFTGNPDIYGYRASKAALNMVTKALAEDYKKDGILFVALHPGWVQTDMGSEGGHFTPAESVNLMFTALPTLTVEHSGTLVSYDGSTMEW